ncbi:hypothetical protein LguiA_009741 [Lonicera macranthoides]
MDIPALKFVSLLALLFISATFAETDSPFIVAHKKVSLTRLKSGSERLYVTFDIYNRGSTTAYDVCLTDDTWALDIFESVVGNSSKSWEKLDAGSLVSHSFELESKLKTTYHGAPALITFRIPTKARLQEAYSTPVLPLDILADRTPKSKIEVRLLAKYGSQVSVLAIVALFVHLIASPLKSSAAKGIKKRH